MIAAIIQARRGSSRLPGKVLADVHGKRLLQRVIERALAIRNVERVLVATTELPEDDPVAACAAGCGVLVHRGAVQDVLDRVAGAARSLDASVIVRLTADNPLNDPKVAGLVLDRYLTSGPEVDYVSNTIEPTWPDGLDVEVFSRRALERAWQEARLPSEREHVTPYIYKHHERFRIAQVKHSEDLSALRWTVDYPEDLDFVRAIYQQLDDGTMFGVEEILALLKSYPELAGINQGFQRNEGYLKSLALESQAGSSH